MTTIKPTATTGEVLEEIGSRLQRYRLQQNRTIDEIAAEAGIGNRSVIRAEAGENPTLQTVIRILRALGRVDALDAILPPPLVSPLELADLQGEERQHASPRSKKPAQPGGGPLWLEGRTGAALRAKPVGRGVAHPRLQRGGSERGCRPQHSVRVPRVRLGKADP